MWVLLQSNVTKPVAKSALLPRKNQGAKVEEEEQQPDDKTQDRGDDRLLQQNLQKNERAVQNDETKQQLPPISLLRGCLPFVGRHAGRNKSERLFQVGRDLGNRSNQVART